MAKLKTGRHTSALKAHRQSVTHAEHNLQIRSKIHGVRSPEAILKAVVIFKVLPKFDDRSLEGGSCRRFRRLCELTLSLELRDTTLKLCERESYLPSSVGATQAEKGEHLRIINAEYLVAVSQVRAKHHVEEPGLGAQGNPVIGRDPLASLQHEKARASDGVQRLDSAICKDRKRSELRKMEVARIANGHEGRDDPYYRQDKN